MTSTLIPVGATLDCGHVRPTTADLLGGIGTGYARTQDGRTLCYPCADASEREAFRAADTFVAYVDSAGNLTTWSGGLLARGIAFDHGVSRSGWHGSEIHSWRFRDRNDDQWYGRNGGPGMVITVRRAKHSTR